jgi:hypothetical protein
MGQSEPPSSSHRSDDPLFFIGRDRRGNWVVQDERHLRGGLFVDRAEALRFALFENGHKPQAVVMVPGVFELDMSQTKVSVDHLAANTNVIRERHAA